MKYRKMIDIALYLSVLVSLYTTSFFLLEKPCKNINKCKVPKAYYESQDYVAFDIYPCETTTCISENKNVNVVAYYFFWPIQKFVRTKGAWFFAKDPTSEDGWRYQ